MIFADLVESLLSAAILTLIAACCLSWARGFDELRRTGTLLPHEPRRPVPWGLVDLIVVALLVALKIVEVVQSYQPPAEEPAATSLDARHVLASAALMLIVMGVSLAGVFLRRGTTWSDVGFDASRLLGDLRLGLRAFVMLAPPVYAIQFLVTRLYPTQHPLILELKEHPNPWFFAACGVSVVLTAPLTEEYFFRVLLQGWLEKLTQVSDRQRRLLGEPVAVALPASTNPYASPGVTNDIAGVREPLWPIFVSATLFALMHFSHGPDPIPLFVLACGLGYLYHRTHRIVPCLVVHSLLNACSLGLLAWEVFRANA